MTVQQHRARWRSLDPVVPPKAIDTAQLFLKELEVRDHAMPSLTARLDVEGVISAISGDWKLILSRSGISRSAKPIGLPFTSLKEIAPVDAEAEKYVSGLLQVVSGEASEFHCFYRSDVTGPERWYKVDAKLSKRSTVVVRLQDVSDIHLTKGVVDEMYRRLSCAKAAERQRIAVELHDSTSQYLAAIGLNLMALRKTHPESKDWKGIVVEMERALDVVQKEVRSINYLLFPFDLRKAGLSDSLYSLADGYRTRTGLPILLDISRAIDGLPFAFQKAVFRIVQESVSNVRRHAHATSAKVRVTIRRNVLVCLVSDNGRGLERAAESASGVGIPGMAARARQFGGKMWISTPPKGGTTVCVLFPLPLSARNLADS